MFEIFFIVLLASLLRAEPRINQEKVFKNGSSLHTRNSRPSYMTPQYVDTVLTTLQASLLFPNQMTPYKLDVAYEIAPDWPNKNRIEDQIQKLGSGLSRILTLYDLFEYFKTYPDKIDNYTLRNFANTITADSNNILLSSLNEINSTILGDISPDSSLLNLLKDQWKV